MSIPTGQLFFEKISHYDRPQEPVTFGIPFPRGALSRAEQFALYDGPEVYCQKSTGSWDDGSRCVLLADLPGGSGKSFLRNAYNRQVLERQRAARHPRPPVRAHMVRNP